MALTTDVNWYIRSTATGTNSGGFDPVIGASGTNRADADTSHVNGTNLTVDGADNTLVVPDGHTPVAADIGNVVVISAGAGFTLAYYTIIGQDGTNWDLDRSPAATSTAGGTWSMGGAFADGQPLKLDSTAPTITSPLAAGHTINVRGDGTDDPATVHYQASNGYVTPPNGTNASPISMIGYNGRPHWKSGDGLLWYNNSEWYFENMKFTPGGGSNGTLNMVHTKASVKNIIFDQNGQTCGAIRAYEVTDSYFGNSGATTAATTINTVRSGGYGVIVSGCVFEDQRGTCIAFGGSTSIGFITDNIFITCRNTDKTIKVGEFSTLHSEIRGNTFDGCKGSSILSTAAFTNTAIRNNLFTRQSKYAIDVGSLVAENRDIIDFNGFGAGTFGQTSGQYSGYSGGSNDVTLGSNVDPYVDEASGDYALDDTNGSALKAAGFPGAFRGIATTSYVDIGAAQRLEAGGGATRLINGGLIS